VKKIKDKNIIFQTNGECGFLNSMVNDKLLHRELDLIAKEETQVF
jgi:hypothetical protein